MKKIKLTQGKFAFVDDEDYEYLNQWKWHASKCKNTYYANHKYCKNNKTYLMHRIIMNTPVELTVDHIDHNGLNNQKYNLRNCTHQQNRCNTNYPRKLKYKGVSRVNKRYRSLINPNGKRIHIGYFSTELEAAKAYDMAAKKYFGEFANLNFK